MGVVLGQTMVTAKRQNKARKKQLLLEGDWKGRTFLF